MSKRNLIIAISCAALLGIGAIALMPRSKEQAPSPQPTPSAKAQEGQSAAPEQDPSKMTTEQAPATQEGGFVPPPSLASGQSAPATATSNR